MCVTPTSTPARHDTLPLWSVEAVMFVLLLAVAAMAYRVVLARHR